MIQIASITNNLDLSHATVVLDGISTGTLTFKACRIPDVSLAVAVTYTGTGPYVLTLPCAGLWYVWTHDNAGYAPTPAAVIIEGVNDRPLNELGKHLVNAILVPNKPGIELALKQYNPDTTLKHIVYGSPRDVTAWPAIVVGEPRFRDNYLATEFVRDRVYSFTIFCIVTHNDEATEFDLGVRFAEQVAEILNIPEYESLILPSGHAYGFAHCTDGGVRPVQTGDRFSQAATLSWSCRTSVGGLC